MIQFGAALSKRISDKPLIEIYKWKQIDNQISSSVRAFNFFWKTFQLQAIDNEARPNTLKSANDNL
jgi:hypothetical protein